MGFSAGFAITVAGAARGGACGLHVRVRVRVGWRDYHAWVRVTVRSFVVTGRYKTMYYTHIWSYDHVLYPYMVI